MTQKPVKIAGCALCKESFKSLPGRFAAVCCQHCIEFFSSTTVTSTI